MSLPDVYVECVVLGPHLAFRVFFSSGCSCIWPLLGVFSVCLLLRSVLYCGFVFICVCVVVFCSFSFSLRRDFFFFVALVVVLFCVVVHDIVCCILNLSFVWWPWRQTLAYGL